MCAQPEPVGVRLGEERDKATVLKTCATLKV